MRSLQSRTGGSGRRIDPRRDRALRIGDTRDFVRSRAEHPRRVTFSNPRVYERLVSRLDVLVRGGASRPACQADSSAQNASSTLAYSTASKLQSARVSA